MTKLQSLMTLTLDPPLGWTLETPHLQGVQWQMGSSAVFRTFLGTPLCLRKLCKMGPDAFLALGEARIGHGTYKLCVWWW